MRLAQGDCSTANFRTDPSLIKLVVRARHSWTALRSGLIDIIQLAEREGVTRSYIKRVVRLAFLSPAATDAILSGRHALAVSATRGVPRKLA